MMNEVAEPNTRAALRMARRVLIKAGTSVVANEDGSPSLTRLGAIVEQIAELNQDGVEVIFVSSGAVGMGKNLLRKQARLNMSFMDLHKTDNANGQQDVTLLPDENLAGGLLPSTSICNLLQANEHKETSAAKSYAAAGQFELMNLYNSLFSPKNVTASQVLLTQADFADATHIQNLRYAIERLLKMGIVPIVNENDAVSLHYSDDNGVDPIFADNDALAALCARHFRAEVLVLLTDVDGVYTHPPHHPDAKLLPVYTTSNGESVRIGEKSTQGRGGMQAKIAAATMAVMPGSNCTACVVAGGTDLTAIRSILGKNAEMEQPRGTLFCTPGSDLEKQAMAEQAVELEEKGEGMIGEAARAMAKAARTEARKLQALPFSTRQSILNSIADALVERREEIVAANELDLKAADSNKVSLPLVKRLKLTDEKLTTLGQGIRQLAKLKDPLGSVKSRRELSDGLEMSQRTVPIGVLLIIFESRPDSLPQIASLALATANGLLLKGGKEAIHSNIALHKVIGDAIEKGSNGKVTRDYVGLVTNRGQVADLLSLDDVIDLVIPRGSNALVSYIQRNTHIPVLGHADGVCHVYVDTSADADDACRIAVDAKTDYPSACNAMETLLLHRDTVDSGVAASVLMALRSAGVKCKGGPQAMNVGLCDVPALHMKTEYGDLTCMVEVVDDAEQAIDWIHEHGSSHTESIVCDPNDPVAELFMSRVDSACVFLNTSTRFADGFRLGLGAEVGISTGRIHARGPVGVEGLLTTKWQVRSVAGAHCAADFAGDSPTKVFTHKDLSLEK